ncbi:MAG: hypothetical protein M1492_09715 [Gammaproteobacteria bacterium]|nr:hypothetical protein [Gammaproteobacteria bacterium]
MSNHETFIGIDIAKDWLDLGWQPDGHTERITHSEEAIAGLCERLRGTAPTLLLTYNTVANV